MYRHVISFLKSININTLSNCSLRDEAIDFIIYTSRILLLRVFSTALVGTDQLTSCSMFQAKCFTGSKFLLTSSCSSHLILQFLIVSPTDVSPQKQVPL